MRWQGSDEMMTVGRKVLIVSILLLGICWPVTAAPGLLDYEKRVARASEQIERIATDADYAQEGIAAVRTLLPRQETIDGNGRQVTVDNSWLHIKLDAYEAAKEEEERRKLLNEVGGYLQSLDLHLIVAEDISREELKKSELHERLRDILSDDKYREKREGPLTAFINRVKKKIEETLRNIFERITGALYGASVRAGWFFKVLVGVAIGSALFLLIRMILKYKRPTKKKKKRTILGEELEEDANPSELTDAAMAAAKAGDFRAAIRKLYIAFLYELSEKNLIELEANATNWEYLTKVSRFSTLSQPMRYLTERFDYFWYGMFPSSVDDFSSYLEQYNEAVRHARAINEQNLQTTSL